MNHPKPLEGEEKADARGEVEELETERRARNSRQFYCPFEKLEERVPTKNGKYQNGR